MEKLRIVGGNKLSGSISCSGAKNAALPMIAATIMCEESIVLKNLPYLQDITTMFELLGSMGSDIILDENMNFTILSKDLKDTEEESISPQKKEGIIWTESGRAELTKVPFFVRGKVKSNAEKYALSKGLPEINDETLYDAKAFFG